MAAPNEALEKAKVGWSKLDTNQKMIISITVILFLAALISLIFWVSRPAYGVLFSNLSPEDASTIVTKLQEKKIPYRLNGTSTVEVPRDKVYETRIALAGEGLPQGGTIGFEIFDRTNFGMTNFAEKVQYRRALEGELGRTISQISELNGARVHIVLPEPSLYSEKDNPATASIIVKPKAGVKLEEGQVRGIVNLVSRSVEGLKAENITVVDTNGNVLSEDSGGSDAAAGNYSKTQLGAKEAYEESIEKAIGTMLGPVLGGESNAVVRVAADLDFSSKETQAKRFEQGDTPVVQSEQNSKETFTGPGTPPGGVAGISNQTPASANAGAQAPTTQYPQVDQSSGESEYKKQDRVTNYKSDEINEHIVEPPGSKVKKLSVAVVVNNDGSKPIQNSTIENLVMAAAGIDKSRGDVLTVSSVPFDTEWAKKEEKAIADAQRQELYMSIGKYVLLAILLLAGLFVLMKMVAGFSKPKAQPDEFIAKPLSAMSSKIEITPEDLMEDPLEANLSDEKRKELAILNKRRQMAREEIQNLAKERPADVAQLLKIWLNT